MKKNSYEAHFLNGGIFMKRIVALISCIILASLTLALSACGNLENNEKTRKITDMAGNEVVLPVEINTVVCQSATCESAVVSLGLADKLLYSASFTDEFVLANELFPVLSDKPKNSAGMTNEELLLNNVDVVFVKSKSRVEPLRNAGLNPVFLDFNSVETTKEAILLMGEILNVPNRAEKCVKYITDYEALIADRMAGIDKADYFSAYYARTRYEDSSILSTYGPEHISASWIELGGGSVITKDMDLSNSNGVLTEEALIAANPDVIFICGFYQGNAYREVTSGKYDSILSAVDNDRIYCCPIGIYDWGVGGCELGLAMIWCAKTLHPELFTDTNLKEVVKSFYLDVADVTISDADVDYIFNGYLK